MKLSQELMELSSEEHYGRIMPETLREIAKRVAEMESELEERERFIDDDVRDFMRKFSEFPAQDRPALPTLDERLLRLRFLAEETDELSRELVMSDTRCSTSRIVHECCDVIYVALGTVVACGVRLRPIWDAVHAANMRKVRVPGEWKTQKPEGWVGADVEGLVEEQYGEDFGPLDSW